MFYEAMYLAFIKRGRENIRKVIFLQRRWRKAREESLRMGEQYRIQILKVFGIAIG